MSDDAKLREDVSRAGRARDLIESELLQEAFAELEKSYVTKWRLTHIDDDKGREKLFLAINVVGKVKDHLQAIMSNGTLAKRALDDMIARPKPEWSQI